MTGGGRKKRGFSKLPVILLFLVFGIVIVALLVRGNGCCVVVQVAVLPRITPVVSSRDASPAAATTPSGKIIIPTTRSTRGASSPAPHNLQENSDSEAVSASEEEEPEPEPPAAAAPYAADSGWSIQWESVASMLSSFSSNGTGRREFSRVGLLNFNSSEVARWTSTLPAADVRAVRLAPAADAVTWEALYPSWIDEESNNRSGCPSLPDPDAAPARNYDLVAVKLPCRAQGWSRDVRRLHLQLSAAKLTLHGTGSSSKAGMVLILTESRCLPLPNLFSCKHLLARRGHAFLYRPDAAYLRHRLSLPVGSCQLAVPLLRPSSSSSSSSPKPPSAATPGTNRSSRQAYATVLHSADAYVCGAIALAQSIRESGSTRDLVALVDAHNVGAEHRAALAAAGWRVRPAPRIRNPHAEAHAYNEWNYSKFRLWQLTDYDKVVFLDADLLVLRNMDFLFEAAAASELSATVNSGARFNSGVMVLEPCDCTFDLLMSGIHDIESYNGGDQGYLNEVFTWWHRLPRHVNFLKYVWAESDRAALARMLAAGADQQEPAEEVHAVHYLGMKPWMCYRDYDCNWNAPALRRFASDEAHARWWAVHDRIQPAELRDRFCALPTSHMEVLEQLRREAAAVNAPDGHWNRTITDPRRRIKAPSPPLVQ